MDSKRFDYSLFNREMERGGRMTYEIIVSPNCIKLIAADAFEVTEDKIFFYDNRRVVAVFISNNILGFREEK